MSENENVVLNDINEFVADCAKSIILNNVKVDEIDNKISNLNKIIVNDIDSFKKKSDTNLTNTFDKIRISHGDIKDSLTQIKSNSSAYSFQINSSISKNNNDILNGNKKIEKEMDQLTNINIENQNKLMSEMISNTESIKEELKRNYDFNCKKSAYLPWITAGIYITLATLVTVSIIMFIHFGII